ncbi:unnamed protein product [Symbiodinium sp. KB8]|nr:unnamed protein product [Symbiodinium sp. KB8]
MAEVSAREPCSRLASLRRKWRMCSAIYSRSSWFWLRLKPLLCLKLAGTVASRNPAELLRTDLCLESLSALSTRQLEELRTVCGLSQNDYDSLSDIVARRSRFHRCLVIGKMACSLVFLPSTILFLLFGRAFGTSLAFYVTLLVFLPQCGFLCLNFVFACATPRANRQIVDDLNQHFRGHASSFSLSFQIVVTRKRCCMEAGLDS